MATNSTLRAGQSIKHLIVDKANSTMLIAVSITVFVVVFCGFAVKTLISQSLYHQRVIVEKKEALEILKMNKSVADDLKVVYESFATEPVNVIGGNPTGKGEQDGDNAQIVLDALPSVYDYPALSSSVEKILLDGGYQIQSIGGAEDGSQQSGLNDEISTSAPEVVEIPYPFSIETTQKSGIKLLESLEKSIRPIYIESLSVSGQGNNLSMVIDMKTYFQPATGLQIKTKEVK